MRMHECDHQIRHVHRGAVLFEVMLAVALFGGAAAFTLAAVRSVFASLDRVRLQQEAVDVAASTMAQLEAGAVTLADVRGESSATHQADSAIRNRWIITAETH